MSESFNSIKELIGLSVSNKWAYFPPRTGLKTKCNK